MIEINWDKNPIIPAIAQDYKTDEVLMLAYMNKEAFELTLETKYAHYFSRSRQRLWKKGETSGHTQRVIDMLIDCDGDTVLLKVEQEGVACHTGRKSCFFTSIIQNRVTAKPQKDASQIYGAIDTLYHTILERKSASSSQSWTKRLLDDKELLLSKIIEEANELAVAIEKESDEQVIYEAADLLYHCLVGLGYRDISPDRVKQEIARRFGMSGIQEKASRAKK